MRATIETPVAMRGIRQNRLEWAMVGLIAAVCAALSILQYRWTGEVSRAERARLSSGLNEQMGRLARAFDDELRESGGDPRAGENSSAPIPLPAMGLVARSKRLYQNRDCGA